MNLCGACIPVFDEIVSNPVVESITSNLLVKFEGIINARLNAHTSNVSLIINDVFAKAFTSNVS